RRSARFWNSVRARGSANGPSVSACTSIPGSPNSASVASASPINRATFAGSTGRPQTIDIAIRNCRTPVSNTLPPLVERETYSGCCRTRAVPWVVATAQRSPPGSGPVTRRAGAAGGQEPPAQAANRTAVSDPIAYRACRTVLIRADIATSPRGLDFPEPGPAGPGVRGPLNP